MLPTSHSVANLHSTMPVPRTDLPTASTHPLLHAPVIPVSTRPHVCSSFTHVAATAVATATQPSFRASPLTYVLLLLICLSQVVLCPLFPLCLYMDSLILLQAQVSHTQPHQLQEPSHCFQATKSNDVEKLPLWNHLQARTRKPVLRTGCLLLHELRHGISGLMKNV